jgi:hypothetical protein
MSDFKKIVEQSENKALSAVDFISKHRIVITIFVICFAVLVAVLQAQSYLNPERNEDKYLEIKSTISTRQIDQEIVDKLSQTQLDRESTAESNFVDDRTNPFAE